MGEVEVRWTGTRARAEALRDAILADDPDSFEVEVEESGLILRVRADRLQTLQATVDDLLACLSAAETALDSVQS